MSQSIEIGPLVIKNALIIRILSLLAPVFFFTAYATYQFWPAFRELHTVARPGDGFGTIGWIYDIHQKISSEGLLSLFGDIYYTSGIAGGFNYPTGSINFFWRLWYGLWPYFFEPWNVYDFTAFVAFILNGLSAFFLAREIKLNYLFSLLFGFIICSLDHFQGRAQGHLSFTGYFVCILTILYAFKISKNPSYWHFSTLAILTWINFMITEYYGYFSLFISVGLFLYFFPKIYRNLNKSLKQLSLQVCAAAILLFVLMASTYPTLVVKQFLHTQSSKQVSTSFHRPSADFYDYALDQPWGLFQSKHKAIKKILPSFIRHAPTSVEFSNRAGYLTFLIPGLMLVVFIFSSFKNKRVDKEFLISVGALLVVVVIGMLIALKPNHPLSLSKISLYYVPMFRVSVRALLFSQIAAILLTCLSLQYFYKKILLQSNVLRKYLFMTFFVICTVYFFIVEVYDVSTKYPFMAPMPTQVFPHNEEYIELAKYPKGYLLETPFYYAPGFPPEADYPYFAGRVIHHKPIVNGISFHRHSAALNRAGLGLQINALDDGIIEILKDAGVRYLIARNAQYDYSALERNPNLTKLWRQGATFLFQFNNKDRDYSPQILAERLFFKNPIHYPPMIFTYHLPIKATAEAVKATFKNIQANDEPLFVTGINMLVERGHYRVKFGLISSKVKSSSTPVVRLKLYTEHHIISEEKLVSVEELNEQQGVEFLIEVDDFSRLHFDLHALQSGSLVFKGVEVTYLDEEPRYQLPDYKYFHGL